MILRITTAPCERLGYAARVTREGPVSRSALGRRWAPVLLALGAVLLILALPDPAREVEEEILASARGRIVGFIEFELPPLETFDPEATLPTDLGAEPFPEGSLTEGPTGDVRVLLLDGPRAGETVDAFVAGTTTAVDRSDFAVGDEVVVTFRGSPTGEPFVGVSDRWRLPVLAVLAAVFVAAVVLVGGGRGLRALVALALTVALVIKVVVPQLLEGTAPLPLALLVAAVVTIVTIGLTEGLGRISLAAVAGTLAGLAITGLLAAAVTELARFSSAAGDELVFLDVAGQEFDVRGLLLGAFVLGALGVLDDVTVTQAATVDELSTVAGLRGRELYLSALRIGRSHIAATVNTLFMAYVGASLPLLVLFTLSQTPMVLTANSEVVAVEIVRALVGSLGIVSAVPLTTAFATWLADRADRYPGEGPDGRMPHELYGLTHHRS